MADPKIMKMRIDNSTGYGDLVMGDGGVETDGALETCAQVLMHCDRTANPNDRLPDGTEDPRGYWGDIFHDYPLGSRFWLMDGKATPKNRRLAETLAKEAANPLVKAGAVLEVQAEEQGIAIGRNDVIAVQVQFLKPSDPAPKWESFWADIYLATLGGA